MAEGFIQIRRGIEDHIERGDLGLADLGVYLRIQLQADYSTGIWFGCAAKLAATSPRDADERTIRRSLENLERIGFLKRFRTQGKRGNYPVLINKYVPQSGAVKGKRLNADATTDWRKPVYEDCREESVTCPRGDREVSGVLKEEERKKIKNISPSKPDGASLEFETFWDAYPKKIGKQEARKSWGRMRCEGNLAEVCASLAAWMATPQWKETQFIPYPATWLNKSLFKEKPAPEAFQKFASRQEIEKAQQLADASVGSRQLPPREPTSEEIAENERTRLNLDRWTQLEAGTLAANPENFTWADEQFTKLSKVRLPKGDRRLLTLKTFSLLAWEAGWPNSPTENAIRSN